MWPGGKPLDLHLTIICQSKHTLVSFFHVLKWFCCCRYHADTLKTSKCISNETGWSVDYYNMRRFPHLFSLSHRQWRLLSCIFISVVRREQHRALSVLSESLKLLWYQVLKDTSGVTIWGRTVRGSDSTLYTQALPNPGSTQHGKLYCSNI